MTAKEMFEELGYFYYKDRYQIIIFKTWSDFGSELQHEKIMSFQSARFRFWRLIPSKRKVLDFNKEIDVRLFKAINKQIEELGWDNE